MVKEHAMLIFTDAKNNNNKFYEAILNEDDTVVARWGRVGSAGQSQTVYGGKRDFDKIIKGKLNKGYTHSKTVSVNNQNHQSHNKIILAETAKRDMLGGDVGNINSSLLTTLIEKLTQINRHQIIQASGGNIQIDDSGLITTPLGLVTTSTIDEARALLYSINPFVQKKNYNSEKYISLLENYLKLIPQKVPARRGWYENFFIDFSSLASQSDLLDQLEGSLDLYKLKEKELINKNNQSPKIVEKLFQTKLQIVEDINILKKIESFFNDNKNKNHESYHLKLKNVFELKNEELDEKFDLIMNKYGNVKRLWHGTRAFNVLSILKNQLIVPKSGGSYHITGRMYGDGLYFSDQSTKALNYSYGFWDRQNRDSNCFMFIADVALGKEYCPQVYKPGSYPVKGYNSVFAKAGIGGVKNNEMIVYSLEQVNLKYLCEFDEF